MTMKVQVWIASAVLAAVGGLIYVTSPSYAREEGKDPVETAKKIAAEIQKGNAAGAKKMAEGAAKQFEEVSDLMHLFRPRNKGGMGWGAKAGANPATDGLEKKVQEFAKAVPATAAAQVDPNLEAASYLAALTELMQVKAPVANQKGWLGIVAQMRQGVTAFTKAAEKKDAAAMSKAASMINSACVNCHSKFKQ